MVIFAPAPANGPVFEKIFAIVDFVQPLASVNVTVYIPACKLFIDNWFDPLLQLIVYGAVPPPGFAVAVPSLYPLQVTVVDVALIVNNVGSSMVTDAIAVHLLLSVAITV